jgi:hypothetical protein
VRSKARSAALSSTIKTEPIGVRSMRRNSTGHHRINRADLPYMD